jgi:protein-tyrosine phosphatase
LDSLDRPFAAAILRPTLFYFDSAYYTESTELFIAHGRCDPESVARVHCAVARIWPDLLFNSAEHPMNISFVDIHCHFLPGIDDGARDWDESLAMARIAVADGISTIVATPHQMGSFAHNDAAEIRHLASEFQNRLTAESILLQVFPGGEVRIEPGLTDRLDSDEILTLGDHHRHVLLELPHEEYVPLESLLSNLKSRQLTAILAHPERNGAFLNDPELIRALVEAGCLMQITAGSLCGIHGADPLKLAEWLVAQGLVHFVATDAHGIRTRRPLMRRAYERIAELADDHAARDLCSRFPDRVAAGQTVPPGRRTSLGRRRSRWWARRASA